MIISDWIQTNSVLIVLGVTILVGVYFIIQLIPIIKERRFISLIKRRRPVASPLANILIILGLLFFIFIVFNASEVKRADWAEILLLGALVTITAVYARATMKMAEEMKEQRLSEARPYLLLRLGLADDELLQWDTYQGKPAPREFKVTMRNEGKGPAINLWAALWHRRKTYFAGESKGYLASGEEWQTNVSRLNTMIEKEEGWLPKLGEHIRYDDPGVVAVEYQDIHKRTWVSYLCLERHVDIEEVVMEGEQNIVEYPSD